MAQDQKQGIYITQEDIDIALQAARPPEQTPGADAVTPLFLEEADIVDSGPEADSEDADYFGLLSKADIEALLHGDLDGSSGQKTQDEIDTLFETTTPEEPPPSAEEADPPGRKSTAQEDVERLMQAAGDGAGTAPEGVETAGAEASEADAAVSQDDIDRLLMSALEDSGDETDGEDGPDSTETDFPDNGDVLSQDDLDRLLAGASEDDGEDVEPEFPAAASIEAESALEISDDIGSVEPEAAPEIPDADESLISQSDLDQLLGGGAAAGDTRDAPSGKTAGAPEHISQDDINRLLKESLEESEDIADTEDDAADESEFQEPVILAAEEEPDEPSPPDSKPAPAGKVPRRAGARKKRIRGKHLVWAAAGVAGIVLVVSMAAVMMSSGPTQTAPQPQVLIFSMNQIEGDSPDGSMLSSTSVRLPGFVVFAPPNPAAVTYVAADLTLDVSDAAIAAVIKENEAFVRDIIYGTISSELTTRDISAIDEVSLERAIRKALGQIVARDAIGRIAFDRFKLV